MCIDRDVFERMLKQMERRKEKQKGLADLRTLSRYGLGCAVFTLSPDELRKYFMFATGKRNSIDERIMRKSIPRAYPAALPDCRGYFFGAHNRKVMDCRGAAGRGNATRRVSKNLRESFRTLRDFREFCLARKAKLVGIKKASDLTGDERNGIAFLLDSPISRSIRSIGIVRLGRRMVPVLLDTLEGARIGDEIIVHRNVACERW